MNSKTNSKPICCPEFNPIPWDDRTFEWKEKSFIKGQVFTLFYMPINFGAVMKRFDQKLKKSGATMPDYLCLSDHTSKWNMDLYLAVDKEIPESENTTISGNFFSKVYEGSFDDTEKWMKDFDGIVESDGHSLKKKYLWYTTCPKCAKKYCKNYVVVLGQIE